MANFEFRDYGQVNPQIAQKLLEDKKRKELYSSLQDKIARVPDPTIDVSEAASFADPTKGLEPIDVTAAAQGLYSGNEASQEAAVQPAVENVTREVVGKTDGTPSPTTDETLTGPKRYDYLPDSDYQALSDAMRGRSEDQFANNLGRAFNTIGSAIGNQKVDNSFYDNLDKQAGQGIENVLAKRKAQNDQLEFSNKSALQDPTSPDNAAFRAFIKEKMPNLTKMQGFENLTLANPALTKIASMYMQSEAQRTMREQTKAQQEFNNLMRLRTAENEERKKAGTQARFDRADLRELQKQIPDSAARVDQILGRINTGLGGLDNIDSNADVPGVGPVANAMPGLALSKAGQDMRSDAVELVRQLLQIQSGQTVTTQEAEQKAKNYGLYAGAPERNFRRGMRNVRDELVATLKKKEAGFDPETIKKYAEQGGLTSDKVMAIGRKPQNDQNAEALKWLQENPNHPKAEAVRKKLGL